MKFFNSHQKNHVATTFSAKHLFSVVALMLMSLNEVIAKSFLYFTVGDPTNQYGVTSYDNFGGLSLIEGILKNRICNASLIAPVPLGRELYVRDVDNSFYMTSDSGSNTYVSDHDTLSFYVANSTLPIINNALQCVISFVEAKWLAKEAQEDAVKGYIMLGVLLACAIAGCCTCIKRRSSEAAPAFDQNQNGGIQLPLLQP